ncbi:MAG: 50S ribosomal protein L30e [Candidatus Thermoplasmatota archaeon]|nr:50S ribosomal protein L30e [Euryarchaeota archaeon]MBU4031168.1 50S ribosomal protein L30e [Candidatus Thermoplasmatota archaeon]MBU4144667.1 50S ribosomal protein L30e [Candidatus Thermoplasmatota archaeon]MBU4592520.1 50S ribosomal protein L30e [Candidatus Thermoplasmatota archaeon]
MDINRALRTVTKTGEVTFGVSQAKKAIASKQGKLIIIASNCPAKELKDQNDIPVMEFPGTNRELGSACGKPFSVSVVTVIKPGESQILSK